MSEGFTRNGKWAPSLGDWLAERLTTDLAEVLCGERDWTPADVFVVQLKIARYIDSLIEEPSRLTEEGRGKR